MVLSIISMKTHRYRFIALVILLCIELCSNVVLAQPNIEKLSPEVNDPLQSEVLPVISIDGRTLYFTRPRMGLDGEIVIDIWRSYHGKDDVFYPAEILTGHLRSRYGIAVTSVTPDNNTLYLVGKLRADTPPEDRVMVSHRTKDGWSIPKPIHIQLLNVQGAITDYSFGPDQRTLIMSVQRDSSMGGRDLYVSFLDEATDTWAPPIWLGPEINSSSDEITPYLAANGKTLYFSSDRPGNIGEVDVWRAERLDDSWKHWSKPEHLGANFNRSGRTTYYTEDAKGEFAYFVWRKDKNDQTDIYRTAAPPRMTQVTLIKGTVTDENNKPLDAEIRYERLSDGKTLGLAHSDPSSGEYQITLPAGESYAIFATHSGYLPTSERFDGKDVKAFSVIEKQLVLVKIKENAVIRLNNIFFETDQATLLPVSFAELNRLASILSQDTSLRVSIEGHTDSTGSTVHNKSLSLARARSVVLYLIGKAIDPQRLSSEGFGSERAIAPNETEEGKAKNRRVEFRILTTK